MKLTRTQELALIEIGLQKVLASLIPAKPKRKVAWNKGTKGRKWTKAQREKFAETMKQKWGNRTKK